MARGDSGRIVLEIDPSHKNELYGALTKDGLTLKDWFLQQADNYLRTRDQIPLFGAPVVAEKPTRYTTNSRSTTAKNNSSTKTKRK
jgi:hypothetical protein